MADAGKAGSDFITYLLGSTLVVSLLTNLFQSWVTFGTNRRLELLRRESELAKEHMTRRFAAYSDLNDLLSQTKRLRQDSAGSEYEHMAYRLESFRDRHEVFCSSDMYAKILELRETLRDTKTRGQLQRLRLLIEEMRAQVRSELGGAEAE
jgi:hypothetical protein